MRDRLIELMPEFDLIQDAALREKTLDVWEAAMAESGVTLDALAQMPFTLLVDPCPVNIIEHVRAVTLTAVRAAEVFATVYGDRLPVDMDVLVAGGLLHDIGKLSEYVMSEDGTTRQTRAGELLRHPFTGVAMAARAGLPVEVQHVIAAHAGEGDKVQRSTEATLLNHADFMSFHSVQRLQQKKSLVSRIG
jgi:putative nucleotidyltransferase with HDIG domain